jgi:hypothetical protein
VHQSADGGIDAQVAVDFLADAVRHLGTQHHSRSALVGLQLVQGGLELPPLRVQRGQPGGGGGSRSRMVVMPESASKEGTGTGQNLGDLVEGWRSALDHARYAPGRPVALWLFRPG